MLAGLAIAVEKPYRLLTVPSSFARQASRLDGDSAVWLEGDVLCFLRRQKAGYVAVTGGVQESMTPLGGDLWGLRVQMPRWRKAVVQYAFFTPEHRVPSYEEYRVWRGPEAPVVPLAQPLRGRLENIDFRSAALGSVRRVTTYLPPDWKPGGKAVFLTDGESTEGLAQALEPLIATGKVAPTALIGIYSGDGRRASELGGSSRFRTLFTSEIVAWAKQRLRISPQREDRAAFGFSSGASFVLQYGAEAFGSILAVAGGRKAARRPNTRYFLSAGTLDPSFGSTRAMANSLGSSFDAYVGGHDFEITRLAFSRLVQRAFPCPPPGPPDRSGKEEPL